MRPLVVVERAERWAMDRVAVEVISARDYLTDAERWEAQRVKVFNLCGTYRYQSAGYYVSLLAEARRHRPVPSVATIQDLKATEIVRIRSEEVERLVQSSLAPLRSEEFVLSIYFGHNIAKKYDRLCARLYALFEAPLLRARFRKHDGEWQLVGIRAIAYEDVPPGHQAFVVQAAKQYFSRSRYRLPARKPASRYDLCILVDPSDEEGPSDERAIRKLVKAAETVGMSATVIHRDDYAGLAEFDALFIRATTRVDHFTFRFASRAAAEDMVVIDDPLSILRCTNKVFLAELLSRHGIATPKTMVLHSGNLHRAIDELGLPCVLKQPDSSFSQGVKKAHTPEELASEAAAMLARSELIIGQSFTPTEYDWRVGVLGGEPLYACKYHMAPRHWQIIKSTVGGRRSYGRTEAVAMAEAPPAVVRTAVAAARLIGNGLYGVDLKVVGRKVLVIEVNDNPTIEAGYEDGVLGDELYRRLMQHFVDRLDAQYAEGRAAWTGRTSAKQ